MLPIKNIMKTYPRRYEANERNLQLANEVLDKLWREKNLERGVTTSDRSGSCKFAALFAREIFGGHLAGNQHHIFTVYDGEIFDLNHLQQDARELGGRAHIQDHAIFKTEYRESLASCVPRVARWVKVFENRYSEMDSMDTQFYEYAAQEQINQYGLMLMEGKKIPLTVILFHEDGYRVVSMASANLMVLSQKYLEITGASAYAFLFDGKYENPKHPGITDCVTCAIITRSGQAKVICTPYKVNKGEIDIQESGLVMVDGPFMHLFDPLDVKGYDMERIMKLLDEHFYSAEMRPYKDYAATIIA